MDSSTWLALLLAAVPTVQVSGRAVLGSGRVPEVVWVTGGRGCPGTLPDDRVAVAADGGLGDVAILLAPAGPPVQPRPLQAPAVEIRGLYCALAPRVQVVPVGSMLGVREESGSGHRLHAYREGRSLWGGVLAGGSVRALGGPGVIDFRCDAGHEWEVSWIYVTEAPYFAVSDASGRFVLRQVPAGRYTLRAWHPWLGAIEAPKVVDPEHPTELVVSFQGREALAAMYPESAVTVGR